MSHTNIHARGRTMVIFSAERAFAALHPPPLSRSIITFSTSPVLLIKLWLYYTSSFYTSERSRYNYYQRKLIYIYIYSFHK